MNDEPSFHTSLEECDTLPLIFFRARSTFVLDATKVMFGPSVNHQPPKPLNHNLECTTYYLDS